MAETISAPTLTAGNVAIAVSGSVNLGPVGTTLPTSTTGSLDAGLVGLGYLSDAGLTENYDVSRDKITAWQNKATVREFVTDAKMSFQGVLIEQSVAAVESYYGTTVTQTVDHGSYTIAPGATSGPKALVVTILDGDEVKVITCTRAEVFKGGDAITYDGSAIGYSVEIVCYDNPVVYDTRLKSAA